MGCWSGTEYEYVAFGVATNGLCFLFVLSSWPCPAQERLNHNWDAVDKQYGPALVYISKHIEYLKSNIDEYTSAGTGFMVNPDGFFITCRHVFERNDQEKGARDDIRITFYASIGGRGELRREVVYVDEVRNQDIVLYRLKDTPYPPPKTVKIESIDRFRPHLDVYATGFPIQGLDEAAGVSGIISGKEDPYWIMTTPVEHGYSGGPVFSAKGTVIGISTGKKSNSNQMYGVLPILLAKSMLENRGLWPLAQGDDNKQANCNSNHHDSEGRTIESVSAGMYASAQRSEQVSLRTSFQQDLLILSTLSMPITGNRDTTANAALPAMTLAFLQTKATKEKNNEVVKLQRFVVPKGALQVRGRSKSPSNGSEPPAVTWAWIADDSSLREIEQISSQGVSYWPLRPEDYEKTFYLAAYYDKTHIANYGNGFIAIEVDDLGCSIEQVEVLVGGAFSGLTWQQMFESETNERGEISLFPVIQPNPLTNAYAIGRAKDVFGPFIQQLQTVSDLREGEKSRIVEIWNDTVKQGVLWRGIDFSNVHGDLLLILDAQRQE